MNTTVEKHCEKCNDSYVGHYNTKMCQPCKTLCRYCCRKMEKGQRGGVCGSCRNKKYKYKLTDREMYRWLMKELCDCCYKPFKNHGDKNQDHNHETGANRGIVCTACNIFIGFVETRGIENATNYLIKYSPIDESNR